MLQRPGAGLGAGDQSRQPQPTQRGKREEPDEVRRGWQRISGRDKFAGRGWCKRRMMRISGRLRVVVSEDGEARSAVPVRFAPANVNVAAAQQRPTDGAAGRREDQHEGQQQAEASKGLGRRAHFNLHAVSVSFPRPAAEK